MRMTKSILAFFLMVTIVFNISVPVNATSFSSSDVYDVLCQGFYASSSISEIEDLLDGEVSFDVEDLDYTDFTDTWINNSRDYIDDYLEENELENENPIGLRDVVVTEEQAKATSISYAMECAAWSLNKGRGTNFGNESVYMFMSHYIDRAEYYWDDEDYQYLMDGSSMSQNTSYFSKWIVADDRTAYNTYIQQTGVIDASTKLKDLATGLYSVYDDTNTMYNMLTDFERVSTAAASFRSTIYYCQTEYDFENDILPDIASMIDDIKMAAGTVSLNTIYNSFITDTDLIRNTDSATKERIIKDTLAFTYSVMIGGIAGGAQQIGINLLSFTYDAYMSLFQFAAWVTMKSSFHGREAQRYYDYLMNMYF